MCCFSGPVENVAATRIFARMAGTDRQLLAYEMQLSATAPVAMILPIPAPPNSADDAVRFISLEHYPDLFADLYTIFYPPERSFGRSRAPEPLKVHEVGAYVASFVPTLADFTRLDPQFRIPPGTIDRVPAYADWGFVVFQLAATRGATRVHPMAFEFPTRDTTRLFFPLVHVHDGELHARAEMDHVLFAQGVEALRTFDTSHADLAGSPVVLRSQGLIDPAAKLSLRAMIGTYPNEDVWATLLDRM